METKTIATIRRNSREEVRVALQEYNGRPVFAIRAWFQSKEGDMRPSRDGLTLRVELLPEVARALAEAERQARGEGLLRNGEEAG